MRHKVGPKVISRPVDLAVMPAWLASAIVPTVVPGWHVMSARTWLAPYSTAF